MKVSEFKKLIREEIYKALKEVKDRPLKNMANLPFHYPWTDKEKVVWVFELEGGKFTGKGPNYTLVELPTKASLWSVKNRSEYVTTDYYGDKWGEDYKYPVSMGLMTNSSPGVDIDDDEITISLHVVGSPETFQQTVKKYLGPSIKKVPKASGGSFTIKTDLSPLVNLVLQASKKHPRTVRYGYGGKDYKKGEKKEYFQSWMKQFLK